MLYSPSSKKVYCDTDYITLFINVIETFGSLFHLQVKFLMLVASQQQISQTQKDVLFTKGENNFIYSNCLSFWS
jgi:hypothetical protein